MAEWLRRGLQILARRFDSGSGLHFPAQRRLPRHSEQTGCLEEAADTPAFAPRANFAAGADLLIYWRIMVPGGGIEPPTLRFSVVCSTN